jgi:hypothetical protein
MLDESVSRMGYHHERVEQLVAKVVKAAAMARESAAMGLREARLNCETQRLAAQRAALDILRNNSSIFRRLAEDSESEVELREEEESGSDEDKKYTLDDVFISSPSGSNK